MALPITIQGQGEHYCYADTTNMSQKSYYQSWLGYYYKNTSADVAISSTGEYPPGYATGNINNEIFKQSQGIVYKSEANGDNWVQMNTDIPGRMEVGNQPGELYAYSSRSKYDNGWYYETTIRHSLNDGADFVIDTIDVSFTGNYTSNSPRIIRGAQEEEFYLVSWWLGQNSKYSTAMIIGIISNLNTNNQKMHFFGTKCSLSLQEGASVSFMPLS